MRRTLAIGAVLSCSISTQAQQPAPSRDAEAAIVEQAHTKMRFEEDGTGTRETYMRVKVQSDAGVQQWGQVVLGYNAATERVDLPLVRVTKAACGGQSARAVRSSSTIPRVTQANSPTSPSDPERAPSPSQRPAAAAANGAIFLLHELINYLSFTFRVPVFICFLALIVVIAIVLQDVYPGIGRAASPVVSRTAPEQIHLTTGDFVKLYGQITFGLYLAGAIVRLVRRGRPLRVRYRTQFAIAAGFATLGWGFVLYNVPSLRVAAGTSSVGLAVMFLVFYLLTLVAFAVALAISWFADHVAAVLGDTADAYFAPKAAVPPCDSRPTSGGD
jgi:hypothetical protein